MKYIHTTILLLALIMLPTGVDASHGERGEMIPIAEYVQMEITQFNDFLKQPDLSTEELSEAISDLTYVLSVYMQSLE